ncbi:hypothetical protein FOA52_001217 [Chlamydomonas sp. UWO 241]|nr:hypothetical protein FOA52_001217 [Chlamydomonas sp. UWO 241]
MTTPGAGPSNSNARARKHSVQDEYGWSWTGAPMSKEERGRRYPDRYVTDVARPDYKRPGTEGAPSTIDQCWVACTHFTGAKSDDEEISLGDSVALDGGDGTEFFIRIEELFEDANGLKCFGGHYFYAPVETVMGANVVDNAGNLEGRKVQVEQLDRRLFLAADEDNGRYLTVHPLNTIDRVVTVARVKPGEPIPSKDKAAHWYDQIHSRRFYTFRDYYQAGEVPAYTALPADTKLNVLELCSGAGGTSFLCQKAEINGKRLDLHARWAFDISQDACAAYQINDDACHVNVRGIDEGLMLSIIWETEFLTKYGLAGWRNNEDDSDADVPDGDDSGSADEDDGGVKTISDVQLGDCAPRGTSGQGLGHLTSDLKREQCWLEFLVETRAEPGVMRWVRDTELPACATALTDFAARERAAKLIPVRGDVDMIMGGPPCQGLSGLNRNAARANILLDPKNRLVKVYYEIVKWFKPSFTLMEQVMDCFKKENGLYARFMASAITAMRYQCRIGIAAAGDYGCPQGRYRVLTWSSKQGMPLPAFPEPSHRRVDLQMPLPTVASDCFVTFQSPESMQAAYPMNVFGDAIGDMSAVSNFSFADGAEYSGEPERPWQVYLRRASPPGTSSAAERGARASKLMHCSDIELLFDLLRVYCEEGPAELGKMFFCKGKARHADFAGNLLEVLCRLGAKGDVELPPMPVDLLEDVDDDSDAESGSEEESDGDGESEGGGDIDRIVLNGSGVDGEEDEEAAAGSSGSDVEIGVEGEEEEDAAAAGPSSGKAGSQGGKGGRGEKKAEESVDDEEEEDGAAAGPSSGKAGREGGKGKGKKSGEEAGGKKAGRGGKKTTRKAAAGAEDVVVVDVEREVNYAAQTWKSDLKSRPKSERARMQLQRQAQVDAYANALGKTVFHEVEKAIRGMRVNAPLRDHRQTIWTVHVGRFTPLNRCWNPEQPCGPYHLGPGVEKAVRGMRGNAPLRDYCPLQCNADDFERMVAVPSYKGACFRQMPGVVENEDGTCCAGHCHAMRQSGSAPAQAASGTKAGGSKAGVTKATGSAKAAGGSKPHGSKAGGSLKTAGGVTKPGSAKAGGSKAGGSKAGGSKAASGSESSGSMAIVVRKANVKAGCSGGGTVAAPKRSLERSSRVDHHDKDGWRGASLPGCQATTYYLPSGDLLCPRWCITYQGGKSGRNCSRQSCFGRIWIDEVQPTVVTRAEPHNLRIVHPVENRVLTIRENMRCQGFPDFWALVGLATGVRASSGSVPARYMQVGNAVAPPMARHLGLCIIAALLRPFDSYGTAEDTAVIRVTDPEMAEAYAESARLGLKSVLEEDGTDARIMAERLEKMEKEHRGKDAERAREQAIIAAAVGDCLTAAQAARMAKATMAAAASNGGMKRASAAVSGAAGASKKRAA